MSFEADLRRSYRKRRAAMASAGVHATLLHVGAEQVGLATGDGPDPQAVYLFAIGSSRVAREYFPAARLTPIGIENAIAAVEDELARATDLAHHPAPLFTADSRIRLIARRAGLPDAGQVRLGLDVVERYFSHVVSTADRGIAATGATAEQAELAATVLVLRECMHHLRFDAITVLHADTDEPPNSCARRANET